MERVIHKRFNEKKINNGSFIYILNFVRKRFDLKKINSEVK